MRVSVGERTPEVPCHVRPPGKSMHLLYTVSLDNLPVITQNRLVKGSLYKPFTIINKSYVPVWRKELTGRNPWLPSAEVPKSLIGQRCGSCTFGQGR